MSSTIPTLNSLPAEISESVVRAIQTLARAKCYARETEHDTWDFAVEIQRMYELGLTDCELRWLICMGLASNAQELTQEGQATRSFGERGSLRLDAITCFVLTDQGSALAHQIGAPESLVDVPVEIPGRETSEKPEWNPSLRRLRMGGRVVKEFRVPAENQELILGTFAEDGWPARIDDPLPPIEGIVPKRRLQSAITCLNRNQRNNLIRFRGDGCGIGILWEPRRDAV